MVEDECKKLKWTGPGTIRLGGLLVRPGDEVERSGNEAAQLLQGPGWKVAKKRSSKKKVVKEKKAEEKPSEQQPIGSDIPAEVANEVDS